jgi:hypothetical protein
MTGKAAVEGDSHLGYQEEHVDGLEIPKVTWWKHRGLRKLYALIPICFLGATVNGYDSSLLNGLQTLVPWQNCELSLCPPECKVPNS